MFLLHMVIAIILKTFLYKLFFSLVTFTFIQCSWNSYIFWLYLLKYLFEAFSLCGDMVLCLFLLNLCFF